MKSSQRPVPYAGPAANKQTTLENTNQNVGIIMGKMTNNMYLGLTHIGLRKNKSKQNKAQSHNKMLRGVFHLARGC